MCWFASDLRLALTKLNQIVQALQYAISGSSVDVMIDTNRVTLIDQIPPPFHIHHFWSLLIGSFPIVQMKTLTNERYPIFESKNWRLQLTLQPIAL